ncbi:MAG TPA: GtrA family protein [Acidimicrobiales bacterium]|nr:GtrA family protein [Acidimicrobiales bacterium]
MSASPAVLLERLRTPTIRKLWRYSCVSAVAVVISTVVLVFCSGVLDLSAVVSNTIATAVATVPSYALNRRWVWGMDGRSHLWKEVVPFWVLAFAGYGFSTVAVAYAEDFAKHDHFSHLARTGLVGITAIAAFGVFWVAKFIIFNRLMFVERRPSSSPRDDTPGPFPAGAIPAGRSAR